MRERAAHERLGGVCLSDRERVARLKQKIKRRRFIGAGRLVRDEAADARAEFVLIVWDGWAESRVGSALLERLIAIAREEGLSRRTGYVMADNRYRLDFFRRLGFVLGLPEGGVIDVMLDFERPPAA